MRVEAGVAEEIPQATEGVTYAKKIRPKTARIDWSKPAARVDGQIRGLSPFPGAWFEAPGDKGPVRVKVLASVCEDGTGAPGEVLDDDLLVACGDGAVRLTRLQLPGKKPLTVADIRRGHPDLFQPGAFLG